MEFYIVVENGEAYPEAYKTYAAAVAAVKENHKETLEDQINEVRRLEDVTWSAKFKNPLASLGGLKLLALHIISEKSKVKN